jgi:hypothetical protein
VADLQELVDDLAAEIGRPISVEDRRWRLLAHSAHTGVTDTVRSTTILTRAAPPAVAAWLDSLGLLRARELVEVPANEELDMAARVVVPVRHDDVLLGFVWVVVGERPLTAAERAALERVAAATQELLWERRTQLEAQQHLLRTLLFDDDSAAVRHAVVELHSLDAPRVAVAVAEGEEGVADHVRRHWSRGLAWAAEPPGLVVVAVGDAAELAAAMHRAGATRAAAAATDDGLTAARAALRQARLARLAQFADPALGAAVAFEELGAWAQVTELWDRAGRPPAPAPVLALAEHRHGDELIEAVEAVLEAGGDVAAAADALHVHRATLYRRLQRAADASGLDLTRGDDRLLAQLGLRILRLGSAAG